MTELNSAAETGIRSRRVGAEVVRHTIDGATPPLAFLAANAALGIVWASALSIVVALVVAWIRRRRGEPLVVIAISTGLVGLYAASAVTVGEGRAFFLPELVLNLVGLVLCLGSLLIGRPVTAAAHRVVRRRADLVEPDEERQAMRRFHVRMTLAWSALFVLHLAPLVVLYAADSVAGLTFWSSFFNKPTLLGFAVVSVWLTHRAAVGPTASVPEPGAA